MIGESGGRADTQQGQPRELAVFLSCSLALLFGQGVVFAGLGVALQAMAQAHGWSAADTGGAFATMIVAACVGATLPVWLIARIGGRATMTVGALVMASGFLTASFADQLSLLYVAMALAGAGFSLLANTPAFAMIAGWSGPRAGSRFGLYLMAGAVGTAGGPVVAQALTVALGGTGYWQAMAALAFLLAALLALALRNPPASHGTAGNTAHAKALRQLASLPFVVMAAAMVLTQATLMTLFSAAAAHLAAVGWSGQAAANALGAQGIVGAIGTGIAGFTLRYVTARAMLVGALIAEAVGTIALASGSPWSVDAVFVPAFGLGSALVTLAVSMLLVEHFGERIGTAGLALIWTLAGAASAGPWIAGLIADSTGSFSPAFWALALCLLPVAAGAMAMPRPRRTLEHSD